MICRDITHRVMLYTVMDATSMLLCWKQQLDREIAMRDYNSGISYARNKGFSDGADKRQKEIARNMKGKNISIDVISEWTGLSSDEIKSL